MLTCKRTCAHSSNYELNHVPESEASQAFICQGSVAQLVAGITLDSLKSILPASVITVTSTLPMSQRSRSSLFYAQMTAALWTETLLE
jgi:hypothetical protein